MKNIETKVRVEDRPCMVRLIRGLCGDAAAVLEQVDTYFNVKGKRLKLREEKGRETVALIVYSRSDSVVSRMSEYSIEHLTKAQAKRKKAEFEKEFSVLVVVKKKRALSFFGHTRIHLDRVTGLGDFLELETVITDQKMSEARKEHQLVIQTLGLDFCEKISVSYSDLLFSKRMMTKG
jgi:predicted adenylyl cyclase CyaB